MTPKLCKIAIVTAAGLSVSGCTFPYFGNDDEAQYQTPAVQQAAPAVQTAPVAQKPAALTPLERRRLRDQFDDNDRGGNDGGNDEDSGWG